MSEKSEAKTECCCCAAERAHSRRALTLEYLTIGYNVIEAVLSVGAGVAASVLSLVAFGFDSVIEVSASVVLVWRLYARGEPDHLERIEKRAQRLVALSFFALGIIVGVEAARDLWLHSVPEKTVLGVVIAVASSIIMPVLARAKRKQARALQMSSLASEAEQTNVCGYLSIILVISLVLYQALGWWWADAVGALAMLPIIFHEGIEAWRGEHCSC